MTSEQARQYLTTRFTTQWATLQPTVTCFIEGVTDPDLTRQKTSFARFKVGLPRVEQGDLNGAASLKRYRGVVEIGLFVPQGGGTKPFFDMQGTVEAVLGMQVVSGIRLYEVTPVERVPAIGWQSRVLLVAYSFDSTS